MNTELSASVYKTAHAKHSRELYFIFTFSNLLIFTLVASLLVFEHNYSILLFG